MDSKTEEKWGVGKKILFRFGCLYILLFTLPQPYGVIPGISFIAEYYVSLWNSLGVWFGSSVLSIERTINIDFSGSGDRLIDYIHLLIYLLLAVFGTFVWSFLDRHRENYNNLSYWIRFHLRYYLFAILFFYGIAKVIKTQFSFPGIWRLLQPIGEVSPMGLAWTFMGFSQSYTVFAGLMEVVAALLFLFRKTTTLGALVSFGVMTNVMMMNFSYDIPVKILSTHLVLFSLFLLIPDWKRLMNTFLLNRTTKPLQFRNIFRGKSHRYPVYGIKILFVGYVVISSTLNVWQRYQQVGPNRERPHLYGLWEVESFIKNGSNVPPLITDNQRWQYLIMEYPGRANIVRMNDNLQWYNIKSDTTQKALSLTRGNDLYEFKYEREDSKLLLRGENGSDSLSIVLNRYDLNNFLLISRKFDWVQEYPFNR